MPWILLVAALELSYFPAGVVRQYEPPRDGVSIDLGVQMDAEVRLVNRGDFHIYIGGTLNALTVLYFWEGWPVTLYSVARAGVRIGVLTVGYEHMCAHPVYTWGDVVPVTWEGWYGRAFVRVSNAR